MILHAENDYERITEIVGILQLIRMGNENSMPIENPLLERWMSEIEDHEQCTFNLFSRDL